MTMPTAERSTVIVRRATETTRRCLRTSRSAIPILRFATVTNGELAYRSYKNLEKKVGLPLAAPCGIKAKQRVPYEDLQSTAAAVPQQPDVVGVDQGRPGLLAVHATTSNASCRGAR